MSMVRGKAKKKALAALNYDLFGTTWVEQTIASEPQEAPRLKPDDGQLPSVEELRRLFDRFNWIYFDGRLPEVAIEYSTRMTAAGSYTPQRRLIKIGRKYHELFPDEVKDTLKHEMIHIVHFRHNAQFKAEAARIGASIRAKSHPQLKRPPRYLYECPGCGREYPRHKRLRMASCGYCSDRGKFDSRFKLKLKQSARQN